MLGYGDMKFTRITDQHLIFSGSLWKGSVSVSGLLIFFFFVFISLFSLGARINNQTANMTKDSFSDFQVSLLFFFF